MKKKLSANWPVYIALVFGSIIMVVPFIWMALTSFKSFGESLRFPPTILPEVFVTSNYPKAFSILPFGSLYYNTLVLVVARILFAVVFSSMAGYAFARLKFKGKNFLFSFVLIQMMLPSQIFIIPQYLMISKMGMLNTLFALIFPGIVSAFGTFFLRQYYMSLPVELEEAAKLDGCTDWQTFIRIMAPLTKTAVMALSIFTAIFAWSDLMWPLIVNMSLDKMTLASGLASLNGQYGTDFPVLMAGSIIAMVPMLIIYLFFQKQFIQGIALTGSKG